MPSSSLNGHKSSKCDSVTLSVCHPEWNGRAIEDKNPWPTWRERKRGVTQRSWLHSTTSSDALKCNSRHDATTTKRRRRRRRKGEGERVHDSWPISFSTHWKLQWILPRVMSLPKNQKNCHSTTSRFIGGQSAKGHQVPFLAKPNPASRFTGKTGRLWT